MHAMARAEPVSRRHTVSGALESQNGTRNDASAMEWLERNHIQSQNQVRRRTSMQNGYSGDPITSRSYASSPLLSPSEQQAFDASKLEDHIGVYTKTLRVVLPFFNSSEKRMARSLLVTVLILAAGHSCLSVVTSYAERDLTTALATRNQPDFFQAIMKFIGVIVLAVPLQAAYYYVRETLILRWRSWLTANLLRSYFNDKAFYGLKVDNPDQRICEDAALFTGRCVDLSLIFFRYSISTISFIGILWMIAPELVVVLLIYASLGTLLSVKIFGQKLALLAYDTSQKEGNLRYGLVRIQEHTEAIAFYNGGSKESEMISKLLIDVIEILSHRINWNTKLEIYSSCYAYLTVLIPTLVVSPRYFGGEIELGVVTQAAIAFSKIMDAASIVVDHLGSFSAMTAEVVRLHDLMEEMEQAKRRKPGSIQVFPDLLEKGKVWLEIKDLSLRLEERTLIAKLNLVLGQGESLLILGPPGCGKSTLLRALAGLWEFGSGEIHTLMREALMFLPQRPYEISKASVRDQLLYAQQCGADMWFSEFDAKRALQSSGLNHLAMRMDEKMAFNLSVGECQKLAFARIFASAPHVKVAFLDEATSALSEEEERKLYGKLRSSISSYVSIGHRNSLLQFHTKILKLDGLGGWELTDNV